MLIEKRVFNFNNVPYLSTIVVVDTCFNIELELRKLDCIYLVDNKIMHELLGRCIFSIIIVYMRILVESIINDQKMLKI